MAQDFSICLNCMINIPIESGDQVICEQCGTVVVEKRTNCDPVIDFFQGHFNNSNSMLDFAYNLLLPPATLRWYTMLEQDYLNSCDSV